MKYLYLVALFVLSYFPLAAQHPQSLDHALSLAGENRKSLEILLSEYRKSDAEKYKAACFLIANMPYHASLYHLESIDQNLTMRLDSADKRYYSLVKDRNDSALYNQVFNSELSKIDQPFRKATEQLQFSSPGVEFGRFPDIEYVTGGMLRGHIEQMFKLRRTNAFTKNISFDDFLRYVLPYRSLEKTRAQTAEFYAERYGKYLNTDTASNVANIVRRYNITSKRLRYWGGTYPFKVSIGADEMFFLGYHDCVSTADYCASILRACGIAANVEYNVAYKFWLGRHYHVSVKSNKGWETFSPESELPSYRNPRFYECLNIFRLCFDRQDDNPFSLRENGEPIPDILANPCIKDVTNEIGRTCTLKMPFKAPTKHNLAYLASFHPHDNGLRPVTWGIVNHRKDSVYFNHVVPDHLYFPVYMDEDGVYHEFGSPFLISECSSKANGYQIVHLKSDNTKTVRATLERKFPRKPHLVEYAKQVPGTYVIGSNDSTFLKADTLGIIGNVLSTDWNVLSLNVSVPYKYYRICGAGNPPRVRLAEIEFLTKASYCYSNTIATTHSDSTNSWVRILDESLEKCQWKAEYDGNPQTAPDRWPHVTLRLRKPQMVHAVRYMVKHADNAVKEGSTYELREWADGYWKRTKKRIVATSSKLVIDGLTPGRLYWLHCLQDGNEEMPFCVDENGTQYFPQLHFLEKLQKIKDNGQ